MSKYNAILVRFHNKANGQVVTLPCIPTKPRAGCLTLRLEMALRPTIYMGLHFAPTDVPPGGAVLDMTMIKAAQSAGVEPEQLYGDDYFLGFSPAREDVEWKAAPLPWAELELAQFQWHEGRLIGASINCAMIDDVRSSLTVEDDTPIADDEVVQVMPYMELNGWAHPEGLAAWTLALLRSLSDLPHDAHNSAARRCVASHMKDSTEDQQRRATSLLAHAICAALREWNADGLSPRDACGERDGMLLLDAAFCDLLERLGECGGRLAAQLRAEQREALNSATSAYEAWGLWLQHDEVDRTWQTDFLPIITAALWADVVRERFAREQSHRPALARGVVHDNLLPMLARRVEVRGEQIIARDGGAVVAHLAPSINAGLALRLADALDVFGRVHAHRLINHLVRTVHEQKEAGVTDFRALDFEGGFSRLRDVIGYTLGKNDELEDLLDAGSCLQFVVPDGQGAGLWTWWATRAARGRKASLRIVVGDPLLPNFNEVYKGNASDPRWARRLIPVLEHEPRLDMLHTKHQGPALTLVWLMLVELRDNAELLATSGAIRTTTARWRDLAERAGLPVGIVAEVLEAWSTRDGATPQLIERSGAEWTLAEPHALARDFIVEAGRRMNEGKENGRRAKKAKQAKTR